MKEQREVDGVGWAEHHIQQIITHCNMCVWGWGVGVF